MAQKVNQDELYQDDIYGNLRESLDKTIAKYKEAAEVEKQYHDQLEKSTQSLGTNAKSVRELNAANNASKATLEKKVGIEAQILKLEDQRKVVTTEQRQRLAELRLEQQKANKEAKQAVIVNKGLETEYQKQSRQLNELRKQYKNLVLEEGKSTKETRKLAKEIGVLDKRLKQVDKDVGQSQRSVGDYGQSLNKLTGILGKIGLAFSAFTIVKDVFNINKEFEASLASLSAITGVTGDAFEEFKNKVVDVASETKKSATEVAGAFEIVGSAKPELLADAEALAEVTKQAIILSQATGEDLEVSAQSLTGTLNQFNLGAEESARVINSLAAGSQAGAAPVSAITESLDKFGTIANSSNISVEESIGLIETLAEKNIKGAEAGTQLRNVLTTLATAETLPPKALDALEQYGVNTALVSDTSVDLQTRLTELSKIQGDVNALNAVFGKSNLVAAQTILQNVDSVQSYADAVTGTETATEQAAINQDTLSAVLDQLRAAWENIVVSFTEGTGIFTVLKDVLKFVANNLETIVQVVATGIGIFAAYLSVTKAISIATKAWSVIQGILNVILIANPIGLVIILVGGLVTAILFLTDSLGGVIDAFVDFFTTLEGFKNGLRAIGDLILGIIAPALQLTGVLKDQRKEVKELTAEQKRNNKVNQEALKVGKELLKQNREEISDVSVLIDALNDENTTREERNEIIEKLNADYPELIGNINLETASTEQLINIKKELIKTILKQGIEEKKAAATSELTGRIIELELQKIGAGEKGITELDRQIKELTASLPLIEEIANKVSENLDETVEGLDLSSAFREGNDEIRELQAELVDLNAELTEAINAGDDQRAQKIRERINGLNQQLATQLEIRQKTLDDALDKEAESEATAGEKSVAGAKSTGKKKKKTQDELNKERLADFKKQLDLELKALEAQLLEEGVSRQEIEKILAAERINNLQEERRLALELFGEFSADYITANLALQTALREADEETAKKARESLEKQFSDLQQQNAQNLKIIESNLIESGKSREEIEKILAEKRIKQLEQEQQFALEKFGETSDEFINANLALNKALQKQDEDAAKAKADADKKRLDQQKKLADETIKIIKEVTDFIIADIDKRISAGEEEVAASQKEQERLQGLADAGNTDAAEALVAEKKREAREKENIDELEKKKRNLLIVVTGLERANQLIQAGDGNPFKTAGSGIKDFISGLPQFYTGTEGTVAESLGSPNLNTSRDGYAIRVDGKEKILNPALSAMTGNMSTEEIARRAMLSQAMDLQRPIELRTQRKHENKELIRTIAKNTEAISKIRIIQQHIDIATGKEVIVDGNTKTTKTHVKGLRL